jgi:hypothetical protein
MEKSAVYVLVNHISDLLLNYRALHFAVPKPEWHGREIARRIEEALIKWVRFGNCILPGRVDT